MRSRAFSIAVALVLASTAGCGRATLHTGDDAAHGTRIARYRIHSRFVGRSLAQVVVTPARVPARPPLLVFLHGKGGGPESNVNGAFLSALAGLGRRAPAVVFPDGGDHSYWHDRRGGAWGRYVMSEVIPAAVRRLGADPKRVAIGGISMGGFAAFDLAFHHPGRFCAVGGHSAAVWLRAGDTAPGAFDDARDFARNDVIALARARALGAPAWLDGGASDPFVTGDTALASVLHIRKRTWPGGHDGSYWSAHYGSYLRFYADALARC